MPLQGTRASPAKSWVGISSLPAPPLPLNSAVKQHKDKMHNTFTVKLLDLQPSQLYISSQKLTKILEITDFSKPESLGPLPIKRFAGRFSGKPRRN